MKKFLVFLVMSGCVSAVVGFTGDRVSGNEKPLNDQTTIDFQLNDSHGRPFLSSEVPSDKIVVVAFLGTECPLVRLYAGRLQQMADEMAAKNVVFLGINSNRQDSLTEIQAFERRYEIRFPILRDPQNRIADLFGATRTPEVFVLDRERRIVYQGRIDDQYGVGYARSEAEHNDLRDAIETQLAAEKPTGPVARVHVPAPGCLIGRVRNVKTSVDNEITYSSHIAGILNRHCAECHREGEIAPFSLLQYDEVVGWAETIREVVNDQRMPPWHASEGHGSFSNERRLSAEEVEQINQWVLAGAPAGDLSASPAAPEKKASEWHIGEQPDLVVSMGKKFDVPAEGVVDYQHIVVDPGFKEDRWIRAAEIVPGNRSVVHHVLVFVRTPKNVSSETGAGGGAFFAGYVPGLLPARLPDGMAKLIPAGSKLVFQMHYTPNGKAQSDETSIGLWFTEEDSVEQVVITEQAINQRFEIPPGEPNWKVESRTRPTPADVQLLALMPHMHVRGKSFRYEAVLPDGKRRTLLDVPRYDFNWQTSYRLKEPMTFPKGTRMECVAHFDNSDGNLNNPDPAETVTWGEQTWNEMMIGYFDLAIPRNRVKTPPKDSGEDRTTKLLARLDSNKDSKLEKSEVPQRFHAAFDRLDGDQDGFVTETELKDLPSLGL